MHPGLSQATRRSEGVPTPRLEKEMTFTCPRCGAVSYNPNDIEAGYCGRCHWWTGDPVLGQVDPTEMERDNEPQD